MTSVGWSPSLRGASADITMLRKVFKPFVKHRWLAYLAITLAMVGAMVLGGGEFANAGSSGSPTVFSSTAYTSTPVSVPSESGYANLGDTASPAEVSQQVKSASSLEALNFLAFSRWHGANAIPSPNVTIGNVPAMLGAGMASIGGLLMTVASTIMWLMGVLLSLAISTNLMSQLANTIDHSFAIVGNNLLAGGSFLALMMAVLLGVTILNFMRGQRRGAFLGFLGGVGALLLLMGMTNQASTNHRDTLNGRAPSVIAGGESNTGASGTGIIQYKGDPFERPNDWAPMSPGWVMAQTNYLLKGAVGAVVGGINSVSNAVGSVGVATDSASMCGRYINGMYTVYDGINVVKSNPAMQVLKSYDYLARAVYFNTYVTAAYGNTESARNVWCRMAEANGAHPIGEQALISRKSGLYAEAVGVEGADISNAFVTAGGSWRDPGNGAIPDQNGKLLASDFFGTASYNLTSNTRMLYYFAACYWPNWGGGAQILPSWNGVIQAQSGKVDSLWSVANVFDIFGDMTGKNGLSSASCNVNPTQPEFGFGIKDRIENALVDTRGGRQFDYSINPTDLIYTITGGVVTPYDRHFTFPISKGNDSVIQAQSFYKITQGGNASTSILFGLVPLILVVMMAKYVLPLILGGLVAQVLGTALLILLPLTIIAWMIPLPATRRWLGVTGLTVLFSFLVVLLFLAITTITLLIIHVLMWVFAPLAAGGTTLSASGLNGSILLMIQVGLSVFIGLKTVKLILSKAFAIDMSSLKNATMSAGMLSGAAIMGQMGMRAPQLFNVPGDILSEDTKRKYDELRNRLNKNEQPKPGSTDEFLKDKDGPGKGKDGKGGLSGADAASEKNGLNGVTSDSDLADVAVTGAGVIGAAAAAARAASDGSNEPTYVENESLLGDSDPIQTAKGIAGDGSNLVLGSGAGAVVPNETELNTDPAQQVLLSNQVAEMSDNLLGGAAPNSQAAAITQPGDAGDYAALGTNQLAVDQAIAAQSIDAIASDAGPSPYRDPSGARGNFDDLIAKQDAMRASMKYADPRPFAEQVLTGSAYADSPLGVDVNGAPLDMPAFASNESDNPVDDWMYSPMALLDPYFDGEQTNASLSQLSSDPAKPKSVSQNGITESSGDGVGLDSNPFVGSDGYWSGKSNEIMQMGSEPNSVFTWADQPFNLADVAAASPAAMAAPPSTGLTSAVEQLTEQLSQPMQHDLHIERFTTMEDGVQVRTEAYGQAAQAIMDEFATREASGAPIDPNVDRIVVVPPPAPADLGGLTPNQVLGAIGSAARATGRGARSVAGASKWFFDTL